MGIPGYLLCPGESRQTEGTAVDQTLSLQDIAKCFELVEECTEMWDDAVSWQDHLTSGAGRLIGGCGGVFGVTRIGNGTPSAQPAPGDELLRGALLCHRGAPDVRETHIASDTDPGLTRSFGELVLDGGFGLLPEVDVIVPVILEKGAFVYRQSDLISRTIYYRSSVYEHYLKEHGIEDMLSAVQMRPDGLVVGLSILRRAGERRFSRRDQSVLGFLTSAAACRLGNRLTTRAHLGRHSLSPRLRDTLQALLEGASEKEIAYKLQISRATVHEYVMALYRRFNVRSRSKLMAHFIRRRPSLGPD
jgi:DNA-binding CsgD family transcriptional regulator